MSLLLGNGHLHMAFRLQIPHWSQEFDLGFKKTPLKIDFQNVTLDPVALPPPTKLVVTVTQGSVSM